MNGGIQAKQKCTQKTPSMAARVVALIFPFVVSPAFSLTEEAPSPRCCWVSSSIIFFFF